MKLHERITQYIENRYNNMKPKTKRTMRMIPRAVILMLFATYFAGLIYSTADLLVYVFGVVLLGIFLFFLPFEKLL